MLDEANARAIPGTNHKILESNGSAAAGVIRLAYALYLIAHNDRIPNPLVSRLKSPREFFPAVIETYAAAAFALSGFRIRMGETQQTGLPEPEFSATSRTGKTFQVEAKRKDSWTAPFQPGSPDFEEELERFIYRKLRDCLKKGLRAPIYWLELSLPGPFSPETTRALCASIEVAIDHAEHRLTQSTEAKTPAYVLVTSHAFITTDGTSSHFAFLDGLFLSFARLERGQFEQAMDDRDRHTEAFALLRSFREVQVVPHGFDGLPDVLLSPDARPIERARVGERLAITLPDGETVAGLLKQVLPQKDTALFVLESVDGSTQVVLAPLTGEEQEAVAKIGELAFGQPPSSFVVPLEDPLALYDYFKAAYSRSTASQILSSLGPVAQSPEVFSLPLAELRKLAAREHTKMVLPRILRGNSF